MGVVPALDEIEDRHASLGLGPVTFTAEQLAFEGREEALAHGVVVRVANRTHRRTHAGFAAAMAELDRSVLGELNWSSQHLEGGGCDDQSKTAFRTIWAGAIVVTRSTASGRPR